MKLLVYCYPDGHVDVGNPWSVDMFGNEVYGGFLRAFTGTGSGLRPDGIDWEITKRMREPGCTLEHATEFARALCYGGLTEAEALALIARNDMVSRPTCVCHEITKAADDVWDRYFRDAWEWSD